VLGMGFERLSRSVNIDAPHEFGMVPCPSPPHGDLLVPQGTENERRCAGFCTFDMTGLWSRLLRRP
jgi:hypothetical protein